MDLGVMAMKGTPHSPRLQDWSLTIRCSLVFNPEHFLIAYHYVDVQSTYSTADRADV